MIRSFFWIGPIGILLVVLSFALLWGEFGSSRHDFTGRCNFCHLTIPTEDNPGKFTRDIDYLCQECHTVSLQNSHPIEMVPSMVVPELFPLDWAGRLTCSSCHDPHAENVDENPEMLRTLARGKSFCDMCHRDFLPIDGRHVGVGLAHSKSGVFEENSLYSQVLDSISLQCLNCHDGVIASDTSYHATGDVLTYNQRSLSHPIGMDYAEAASRDPELNPVELLAPAIMLPDGKVGCISCHNPYSKERMMTVVSNYGSALCLECHKK